MINIITMYSKARELVREVLGFMAPGLYMTDWERG